MGAFVCKQPNGLYCRFSTVVDCPTNWNMTRQDYINFCVEKAKQDAEYVLDNSTRPFEWVSMHFVPVNMTVEEFKQFLKETSEEREDEE